VTDTRTDFVSMAMRILGAAALAAFVLLAPVALAQDTHPAQSGSTGGSAPAQSTSKDDKKQAAEPATTKIRINVVDPNGKPVDNASVYVRYNLPGGLFHKEKLSELNFKTNQEGSLKVPEVPQGRVMIQVIAKGWHTFGQWYDMDKDEETISIKLEQPVKWY
jgi:hypothetical protein